MTKWIMDLMLIGVISLVGYVILVAIDRMQLAKLIVMVAVMMGLLATMQDLTPVLKGISDKVNSLQNSVDKIGNISQGSWQMPMKGEVSQIFKGKDHHGIDIAASLGTPVEATRKGEVKSVGWSDIYGNVVIVDHGGGMESLYGHLQGISVKVGYPTIAGTRIGTCGSTGNSTGPHLHFEIRKNGQAMDPLPYFK